MFGFHSLAPAKLYTASEKTAAPKSTSAVMGDTQSAIEANGPATIHHSNGPTLPGKTIEPPQHSSILGEQHSARATESQDSAVSGTGAIPHPQGPQPKSPVEPAGQNDTQNGTAYIDFTNPQAEAGPSQPRLPSSHSSLQPDADIAPDRPDETHENAIAYRRDPETVIAYLVPLPKPTVQGTALDVPPKYFLYAPPPPHLIKPTHGSEGYVRKLNRHWQQNLRKSKVNAHNGKRFSLKGIHSKTVRGCVWGMDKLKYDDVTFLARIHPKTVTHLILIHPWALSGVQTPEEMLRTFRAQIFASKKKAKRGSIISAFFFLPALVIDTAAIFFGGLAEIDGIWMLVSITAYRTARVITRKIGPEPKTMEIEQQKLIDDAKRSGFPPPEPEPVTDSEPGAIRRSVDALRRSMGSVKYRMSQRRSRSKRRKGGDSSSAETSRPQTGEASRSDLEGGFTGGELEHYQEEDEGERPETSAAQSTTQTEPELAGFLEHYTEDETAANGHSGAPGSSGGIFADGAEGHRTSGESAETDAAKKGQNFQLTFYPSPAMDVLTRYLQESCHNFNGQAYPSPSTVPTEKDVLAVLGWHPEKRHHETAEEQADDEQWQIREIEDDLKLTAAKAARDWNKACRKQAKNSKRFVGEKANKKGVFAGRLSAKRQKAQKGKAKEASPTDSGAETDQAEQPSRAALIKARMAAVRAKAQRKEATETGETPAQAEKEKKMKKKEKKKRTAGGRAAGGAAILCIPCIAIAERAKQRKKTKKDGANTAAAAAAAADAGSQGQQAPAEEAGGARRQPLKQRLSERSDAMKRGLSARGDALSQRMEARKAKKKTGVATTDATDAPTAAAQATDAGEVAPTPAIVRAQTTDVVADDQAGVEDNTTEAKTSKKGRLLAIPAGVAAAIGAAITKRRQGKQQKTTTTSSAGETTTTTQSTKPSRFSALKERLRALRTRITKRRNAAQKDSSKEASKKKAKSEKTKSKKTAPKEKPTKEPKGVKEQSAIVGLVAGCLALPAVKAKEVRDKRRKSNKTQPEGEASPAVVAVGATDSTAAGVDRTSHDRPTYQPPVVEEAEVGAGRQEQAAHSTTQYLPGHGQSEIPVREPERPLSEPRLNSSDTAATAVEETAAPTVLPPEQPSQHQASTGTAAAAVRFKSIRDGIGNLKQKRHAPEGQTEEAPPVVEKNKKSEPKKEDEAVQGGRLQNFRSGLENFKAKRRAGADTSQVDVPPVADVPAGVPAGVPADNENLKEKTAPAEEPAAAGGRFKTIKDGIDSIKAKRAGTQSQEPKQKVYKDHTPGFIDRLRWIWYVA